MTLIYSFVARGTTVLAEYTAYSGNFKTVALDCLRNVESPDSKFTINCDGHSFNFLNDGEYTFLIVAKESYGRTIPFGFLDRVAAEFQNSHGAKAHNATEGSLSRSFGPVLKNQMEYCEQNPQEISKVAAIKEQVNKVRDTMVKNIDEIIGRGERIDHLVIQTDELQNEADRFKNQGRQLRTKMWWQNFKMKATIVGIVLMIILVIFLIACFSGSNCV